MADLSAERQLSVDILQALYALTGILANLDKIVKLWRWLYTVVKKLNRKG